VSAHRRKALQVTLAPTEAPARRITVSIPSGWEIARGHDDLSPLVLKAQEIEDEERQLAVMLDPLAQHVSPLQVALREIGKSPREKFLTEPIELAGSPGVLVSCVQRAKVLGLPAGYESDEKIVVAATVLPSGRALSIGLFGSGE